MTEKNDLIIRIAGEGGEGIVSTGDFISAACARAGLEIYTFKTFPAEIKGGYCLYQLRTSAERVYNQGDTFDVFVAYNGEAYELNKHLLTPGTAFVYDGPGGDFEPEIPEASPPTQSRCQPPPRSLVPTARRTWWHSVPCLCSSISLNQP